MRFSILTFVAVSGLLFALPAQAQFGNRSLGVGATVNSSIASSQLYGLTLEGSYYIENGFDLYLHIPLMLVSTPFGADTPTGKGWVFGSGGHLGPARELDP